MGLFGILEPSAVLNSSPNQPRMDNFTWDRFPPEVREMIITHYLHIVLTTHGGLPQDVNNPGVFENHREKPLLPKSTIVKLSNVSKSFSHQDCLQPLGRMAIWIDRQLLEAAVILDQQRQKTSTTMLGGPLYTYWINLTFARCNVELVIERIKGRRYRYSILGGCLYAKVNKCALCWNTGYCHRHPFGRSLR